ncbi:Bromodomain-containing protein [Jaminaea rosea]|uniref:Bromodomain-containing protein n=1 Tax=Jaminaea rosea TaxID=1569628 RepID=A0A316UJV1_9BASI|nr:Bromodomain-containing protein [Jaminaea rosea]PWN25499.1 Bromodomain-containing protein [Jaminaea rosea]
MSDNTNGVPAAPGQGSGPSGENVGGGGAGLDSSARLDAPRDVLHPSTTSSSSSTIVDSTSKPTMPSVAEQTPSINISAQDSTADAAAARAAVQDPLPTASDNLATSTRPVIQPPTSDMRSDVASAPVDAAAPPINGSGAAATASAQTPAMTSDVGQSTSAPQPIVPPTGTGNPYDAREEAEIARDAPPASSAAPPAAEIAPPSTEAVAPKNESVLSPVDVRGQAIDQVAVPVSSTSNAAPTSADAPRPAEPVAPVQSSIAEPASQVGVDDQAKPADTSLNGETKPEEATTQDAVMADGTVSSSVAPAVAGMGGAPTSEEPPMKKLKTSPGPSATPSAPAAATPAGAAAAPPAPAIAAPPAHAEGSQLGAVTADPSTIGMTQAQIKFAQNSVKSLKQRPEAPAFLQPVDPVALNIPQYRQIIEKPMDLGTIDVKLAMTASALKGGKPTEKTKTAEQLGLDLSRDVYKSVQEWESDVRLVFANCIRFNGPDHAISQGAKALDAVFAKQLNSMPVEGAADSAVAGATGSTAAAGSSAAVRRPSNPVPTIRRSSSDNAAGRPKREIHPPPPRDLHYEEPASSGRKRKNSKAMTPKQAAYWAKVNADELKFCLKLTEDLSKTYYELSWVFIDLPDRSLAFAPAYYATIKQPISLSMIADKIKKRDYEDKDEFVADMRLLFQNCYTFNPPEEDVHKMGQKLEGIFNEKMRKLPKPKAMTPELAMDEDEDGDGEEDFEEEDRLRAEKIRELEEQLAELKRQAKAAKQRQAGKKKPRASGAAGGSSKKAASSKKSAGGASTDAAPKKSKSKKTKGGDDGSEDDEDVRSVSWEQKEELARKITQLSDERLDGALQIISEDKPPNANDDEEIELDIEDLSPRTLYKLYRYVVKPKKKPGPKPGTAKASGSGKAGKQATGGKKRKNLDEEEEAARIARLQEQLQSFDRAPDGQGMAMAGPSAGAAAGHDDLVQSESSSGEEDSDASDSDY